MSADGDMIDPMVAAAVVPWLMVVVLAWLIWWVRQ